MIRINISEGSDLFLGVCVCFVKGCREVCGVRAKGRIFLKMGDITA